MARWSTSLPDEFANRPDLVAAHRQMQLAEIEHTIRLGEIRCLSFEVLLSRIERLWLDSAASELVFRLCEEDFSHNELHALGDAIRRLANVVENLPAATKSTMDRAIRRVLCRMPPEIACPIVEPWLEHKRKLRREIAYRVLRDVGVTTDVGPRLLAVFQRTYDQDALKLIARNPGAAASSDADAVLEGLDEEYWRMRMLEALLSVDPDRASALKSRYPREFVWAIGRKKAFEFLPVIKALSDSLTPDLDFLSLYGWALGQLGASDNLQQLKETIRLLRIDLGNVGTRS
jgi:hypothetical protein